MLPLIEREVVEHHHWMTEEEFFDLVAVAQSAPGIIAVNSALVVGYKVAGFIGSAMAALGAALPSFIIMLFIAKFFGVFRHLGAVEAFMTGAAPVVVALLFYASYSMGKRSVKDRRGLIIGLLAFAFSLFFGISPIFLIIMGGLAGYFLYYHGKEESEGKAS